MDNLTITPEVDRPNEASFDNLELAFEAIFAFEFKLEPICSCGKQGYNCLVHPREEK